MLRQARAGIKVASMELPKSKCPTFADDCLTVSHPTGSKPAIDGEKGQTPYHIRQASPKPFEHESRVSNEIGAMSDSLRTNYTYRSFVEVRALKRLVLQDDVPTSG